MNARLFRNPRLRFAVEPDGEPGGGEGAENNGSTEPEAQEVAEEEPNGKGDESADPAKLLEKIRKVNSENANLRKRAKEAEQKAAGGDEATKQATALAAENMRLKVGIKHGLPEAVIDRLKGETEEELLADAQALLELLAPKAPPTRSPRTPLGGAGAGREVEETDLSKIGERMFRR